MIVLAIDPGNVTGLSFYDTRYHPLPPITAEIPGGLPGFIEWYMTDTQGWWKLADHIVIEDFIINASTHKKTAQPDVWKILGWVEGTCYAQNKPRMTIGAGEHTSFTAYKLRKKSKIVRLGWDNKSKDLHADSASSILLVGLTRLNRPHADELLKEITYD